MRPMSTAEALEFLNEGSRTGKLAWVAADGRPHVTPIWFIVEDGDLLFATATAGYFSLRGDIATGNASLRAELLDFRAEFNRMNIDHTERLTRIETVQAQHTEQLGHIEAAHPHPAAQ